MSPETQKKKRIRFNWQDVICIVIVLMATAGIFTYNLLTSKSGATENTFLCIKYRNKEVTSQATILDSSGNKMDYTISLRRNLASNSSEKYVDTSTGTKHSFSISEFKKIADFSSYSQGYLIVTGEENDGFNFFSDFIGPQVDIHIYGGGFIITKEDSPNHVCSNQGFVTYENLPVICLPNSLNCSIMSNRDTPIGPDA